jgi:hypothetical protein
LVALRAARKRGSDEKKAKKCLPACSDPELLKKLNEVVAKIRADAADRGTKGRKRDG